MRTGVKKPKEGTGAARVKPAATTDSTVEQSPEVGSASETTLFESRDRCG